MFNAMHFCLVYQAHREIPLGCTFSLALSDITNFSQSVMCTEEKFLIKTAAMFELKHVKGICYTSYAWFLLICRKKRRKCCAGEFSVNRIWSFWTIIL